MAKDRVRYVKRQKIRAIKDNQRKGLYRQKFSSPKIFTNFANGLPICEIKSSRNIPCSYHIFDNLFNLDLCYDYVHFRHIQVISIVFATKKREKWLTQTLRAIIIQMSSFFQVNGKKRKKKNACIFSVNCKLSILTIASIFNFRNQPTIGLEYQAYILNIIARSNAFLSAQRENGL